MCWFFGKVYQLICTFDEQSNTHDFAIDKMDESILQLDSGVCGLSYICLRKCIENAVQIYMIIGHRISTNQKPFKQHN